MKFDIDALTSKLNRIDKELKEIDLDEPAKLEDIDLGEPVNLKEVNLDQVGGEKNKQEPIKTKNQNSLNMFL